ncbi:MAG: transcriptional repressor [Thermoanaerobacterales bacterium]|jgi:Fur family ferric uptake transcriptional regulator|nr:transcriptional repressor [Thermoanaerobacterales bacterium]
MNPAITEKIREKILQWTPQRRAVLTSIADSRKKHLTAEEIYLRSKKIMPSIGLATIYRTLELFCTEGILQKLNLPDEPAMYELLFDGNNSHCHYVCLECGKIIETPVEITLKDTENQGIKDFIITDRSCWHFGYCKNCMVKMNKNGR